MRNRADGGEAAARSRVPIGCLVAVWAIVGILLVPSTARAQAVTGTLLGNVTDSSGAGVPGATVTALEVQTNTSRTAVTNEAGNYIFSSLQNGTYTVECRAPGLQEGGAAEREGRGQHDRPRRPEARSRPDQRDADRLGRDAPAADGPDRHRTDPRVEDGVGAAAHLQPELPVAADHGAGRDAAAPRALAVLQLAGLAAVRGQRPARAWRATR